STNKATHVLAKGRRRLLTPQYWIEEAPSTVEHAMTMNY
ncbi:hypothetical protein Goarm_018874, partial [Gossypium armourianum]|nr:hypothetical protein [Gossypium armourianum]